MAFVSLPGFKNIRLCKIKKLHFRYKRIDPYINANEQHFKIVFDDPEDAIVFKLSHE